MHLLPGLHVDQGFVGAGLFRAFVADDADVVRVAQQIEERLGLQGRFGVLCDDQYGQEALYAAQDRGWWIGRPLELPVSNPLVFEAGRTSAAEWVQQNFDKIGKMSSVDLDTDYLNVTIDKKTKLS